MAEKIDLTEAKDGGVLKEIVRVGEGDAQPFPSSKVFVHYHGTLEDGTVFDSSRDRGQVFDFQLGVGQVIKAWDIGVASMKKGELARLTCTAPYAYGEQGSPPKIPPNATLIFEVELLRWSYEDISPEQDGSIELKVITKGEMYSTPKDLSSCTVHLRGTADGKVFDERDVTFVVGEALAQNVCSGVEIAVQKMKKGEKCDVIMKGKYTTHEGVIPPNQSEVTYTVTLHDFEKAKEAWEMNSDEKISAAEADKTKGTEHFKAGRLDQAVKYYKRVRSFMESEDHLEGDDRKKRDALFLSSLLNLALVYLKQDESLSCIEACNEALKVDEKNVKALFRRGQAQLSVNEFELAQADFSKCTELEPDNKAALSQLQFAKAKQRAQLEKEKKMFRTIFQKMAEPKKTEGEQSTEEGVWNNEQAVEAQ